MAGYYDVVLGLIPLALGSIVAALWIAGIGLTVAVPVAALVAVGLIGHGMFINAPTVASGSHSQADNTVAFESAD